jgi:hypothetical protein
MPFFFIIVPSFLSIWGIARDLIGHIREQLVEQRGAFAGITAVLFCLHGSPQLFRRGLRPVVLNGAVLRGVLRSRVILAGFPELALVGLQHGLPPGTILDIPMDYSRYGALEGFIRANAEVRNVAFAQNVVVTVAVEDTNLLKFMKEVTERSDGRCTPVTIGTGYMKKEEI